MKRINDESHGIIPLKNTDGHWNVLLVQLHAGHWGFPKGHGEIGETGLEAATRELFEETGLKVTKLIETEKLEENYVFKYEGSLIIKKVTYYLAEVEGSLVIQEDEVKAADWVRLDKAYDKMTFQEGKNLVTKVMSIL